MVDDQSGIHIAVASGKGGTGKTTIAVSLALALAGELSDPVMINDCDVEAPNAHLFLEPEYTQQRPVNQLIPEINLEVCSGCGICAEVCQFSAVILLKGRPVVFPELCHSCGSCSLVCPDDAVHEIPKQIGVMERGSGRQGIVLQRGLLNVGEPMAVPLIRVLKQWNQPRNQSIEITDCPPGTSCPVVESVSDADYVLLVTEPTPLGLHDLKGAFQITRLLGIPAGVVVNRAGLNGRELEIFCKDNHLPILLQVPLDKKIGQELARGNTLLDVDRLYQEKLLDLFNQIYKTLKEQGK